MRALRSIGLPLLPLLSLLLCADCKDGATPVDAALPDSHHLEAAPALESRAHDLARDRGPDGPSKPGTWKQIAGAPVLYIHTLTLLQNGDALIVGGFRDDQGSDVPQSAAYRFVVAEGKFVDAGTMNAPRAYHTATLLADGRVLVVGGQSSVSGGYLGSTELYDPTKPAGSAWSAGPTLPITLAEHAATALKDGRVLITGGWIDGLMSDNRLFLYDPAAGGWAFPTVFLNERRRRHTSTLLTNGKVLLAGGIQGTGNTYAYTYLDSLEVYDPATGTSTVSTAKMEMPRMAHSADLLADGRVLIGGGICFSCPGAQSADDLYDPATDQTRPIPHYAARVSFHAASRLQDGRVLFVGGIDSSTASPTASTVVFDPRGVGAWVPQPDLSASRSAAKAVTLLDGTVLVVGGGGSNGVPDPDFAERFYP